MKPATLQLTKGWRMYFTILGIFLVYAVVFISFQNGREKQFRISLLDARLQEINHGIAIGVDPDDSISIETCIRLIGHPGLRVTITDLSGNVVYDNVLEDPVSMPNHAGRREISDALRDGKGYDIVRLSESTNEKYFYSATSFPEKGFVVRTALPYDLDLYQTLKADQHFIWLSLLVIIILSLVMRVYVSLLDDSIRKDRDEANSLTRRQLTQNISHELKTPVSSVQGYMETILENPEIDRKTEREFLERGLAQTRRLTALLEDLSTLNRLWDAPQSWTFGAVDVSQMMQNLSSDVMVQLERKAMSFHNELPFDVIINGNESLIYSIFRNLADNSIAYAGQGTRISVSAHRDGDDWVFEFADNGPGVPNEHLEHLFERFYRVDSGRSRKTGGSGLGLAIVKNAVQFHGGSVSAVNDHGLKFTIRLPRYRA